MSLEDSNEEIDERMSKNQSRPVRDINMMRNSDKSGTLDQKNPSDDATPPSE
jgi:hypothetical protein